MSKNNSKFLNKLKPWLALIPQVEAPTQKIPLRERLMWTLGVLVIFLVASQTPLYGVRPSESGDPLYWFRAMLASNRGSLMELGISPIVTSSLVMQLLAGSKLFQIDQSNEEQKNLFQGAQKLFGILITIGEAVAYVLSGMYGSVPDLGFGNVILIILQLFLAGILVMMLDETLQRGHGIGSGISLFIATNICENIIWNTLSPTSIDTGAGVQYEGAVIALFHLLLSRRNRIAALKEAFYRPGLPNLSNLIATVVVFVVVIFFQGFRVDLPVKNQRSRNNQGFKYPIKLFYTSNIPIILQTALVSNVYFLSQVLSNRFGSNIVTNLLGSWKVVRGISVPIGGLVYYISPPRTLYEVLTDPIHAIIYFAFILITCALFSVTWIEVSGSSPRDVAKQFKDQGLVIRGHRENSTVAVLERYIPIASAFGGMCIGALTVFADFMGAIGSGTGILLAVTIIFEIFETYVQEAQKEGLNLGIPGLQI